MVVFINGSFGIGKTTVARLLAGRLAKSAVFDPEPLGLLLSRLARMLPFETRTDDFQDLVSWRRLSVRAIRLALLLRETIIVPMAFSNATYLDELRAPLQSRGIPTLHFCLTAPHDVVVERLRSRAGRRGPTRWQLRRSAECCSAHQSPEFAAQIPTADRSALEVATELADRLIRLRNDGPGQGPLPHRDPQSLKAETGSVHRSESRSEHE